MKDTALPYQCAPQEALRDLDRAFQNFFRGLKEGRKVGFPRFKKKGLDDSFRLTGAIHVLDRTVQLPRLGAVRLKEGPRVRGWILSATVSREASRWYVSLTVAAEMPDPVPVEGPAAGIDVGLSHFATIASGGEVQQVEVNVSGMLRNRRLAGTSPMWVGAPSVACWHTNVPGMAAGWWW